MAEQPSGQANGASFVAPHPGSKRMPRWNTAELIDAPRFTWRNWFALLGPGLLMGGSAIGGGEWLTGPLVTARYGGGLFWLATLSILGQVIYNIEISRYTLYTGEPIFTGKFRTLPGPRFWVFVYLLLDWGAVFPYLAASAATPLAMAFLGRTLDTTSPSITVDALGMQLTDNTLLKVLSYGIFLTAMLPLIFGGKIYNALKWVMTFKIVVVLGFLLVIAAFYSEPRTWQEIFSGFVKFGNVPVKRAEDLNQNGVLDPGEDYDGDGHLDQVEDWKDHNGDGNYDPGEYIDADGDGRRDGDNLDNVFLAAYEGRPFPTIDLTVISLLCAMVAISGAGGLSNTPISNYTRDQGWGMGHHVGAIPSVVGGHNLELSHVGTVFQPTPESLPRWRRWYRHVMRDQLVVWMPACFLGLALPSMLSVQFLPLGTEADKWTAAGMTAEGVQQHVGLASGAFWGNVCWFMTVFCGFLVLAPTVATSSDGVIRRWVDVFWTSSARLRKLDPRKIRLVYFAVLCGYASLGLFFLVFVPDPGELLIIATNIYNYALGFSCWHALTVNCILLPRELRPNWFVRLGMFLAGTFFLLIAGFTTYSYLAEHGWI